MSELGYELLVGDASAIHASAPRAADRQSRLKRDELPIASSSSITSKIRWVDQVYKDQCHSASDVAVVSPAMGCDRVCVTAFYTYRA